ncbi:uncharacterized protein LOC123311533 [Coccinella septempunctata]|uniref:uncharacterized protein LOC123311533 n=1 Tax=Coccinella septempunctata TaxID=41139 RepID=UPI001D06E09E|nr:uncharacterized protein LOC123311533 [Coccinella septempunctata]
MSLFVVLITALHFLSFSDGYLWTEHKECDPRYHYWQPFCDSIPPQAYVAGVDKNGLKKYIARVMTPDGRSWSAPTTISKDSLHIFFTWPDGKDSVEKITDSVEILCVYGDAPGFGFRDTEKVELVHTKLACCFVEGGVGYVDGKQVVTYVGRTLKDGKYYVGGVSDPIWRLWYTVHPMRYIDEVGRDFSISQDFDVLAYDCCTKNQCKKPNRAECCYDILK